MTIHKKIALLPGDGIGKEVNQAAKQVLESIAQTFGYDFRFEEGLIGHAAIEATGDPLPESTLKLCQASDGILLGAVGDPSYDNNPQAKVRPEQGLLKIRKELGLFANIRPIQIFEALKSASSIKEEVLQGVDIVFFRELTGGIYFGQPRERKDGGLTALDTMIYSRHEVERIAHKAFRAAQTRRKKLCSVDKANVLESSRLWRETVQALAPEYPDVAVSHMYVDNAAMQLVKNPRQFDVILTGNMFGDILSDLASELSGSLGMLPSASIGEQYGLYEPIHGSAPDIAGQGIANPMASILSAAWMLDISFGLPEAAQCVKQAVEAVLLQGYRTADLADRNTAAEKRCNTREITQKIIEQITQKVNTLS